MAVSFNISVEAQIRLRRIEGYCQICFFKLTSNDLEYPNGACNVCRRIAWRIGVAKGILFQSLIKRTPLSTARQKYWTEQYLFDHRNFNSWEFHKELHKAAMKKILKRERRSKENANL